MGALGWMLSRPAEFFDDLPPQGHLRAAVPFAVLTSLPPAIAVGAMLFFEVGLGDKTRQYVEYGHRNGALTPGLVGMVVLGLICLALLGWVAHVALPGSARLTLGGTVSVVLFAFGVRVFHVLPGFEVPTLAAALGLATLGLQHAGRVSLLRAAVAVGVGTVVAALLYAGGTVGLLLLLDPAL